MHIRYLHEHDYPAVIAVIDQWWSGRHMADMLPKLFFVHFQHTSFAAEEHGQLIAFLAGFVSQTYPDQAYIHFVGIDPDHRQRGLGRQLYERFFAAARERGCSTVRCVTSPVNTGSIAFHTHMGFQVEKINGVSNGVPCTINYDGNGQDRVLFVRSLI
jgi:ribosomal protein S18 acetylase RimI-like enzyme